MGWLMSPARCWFLGVLLLITPQPGSSWYKHSASPRYHTVGRASGLLIGVRRSPYLWRRDLKADNFPVSHQGAAEGTGVIHGPWRGAGTEHQLYPDPGENRRLVERFNSESMGRGLEERGLHEVQGTIQDAKSPEQWTSKELGEERSLGGQTWLTKYPGDEDRDLRENMLMVRDPGEVRRTLEEVWVTKPGEVSRSLEDEQWKVSQPGVETRSPDREVRTPQGSDQERRPSVEDILSMVLQEESRSHPWSTQTRIDKQVLYPKSKTAEWMSCEDLPLTSYKVLCRASLRFLSRSQPQPWENEA
ncbi:neuropeptide W [Mixophyes fleayi]|uniref:neuropeptide W n=1 Tax=Mixophyes fleayi TaxID=3061075 RepID=UPI003F4D7D2F